MPTTRRRIARGRTQAGGITEDGYQFFRSGPWFGEEDFAEGKTQEELKQFWQRHKKGIMERCLRENKAKGWVGYRPAAFWDFEITEPQRKTPEGEFDSGRVWDHQRKVYDWVENDTDYLGRLNLLEPWEMEKGGE